MIAGLIVALGLVFFLIILPWVFFVDDILPENPITLGVKSVGLIFCFLVIPIGGLIWGGLRVGKQLRVKAPLAEEVQSDTTSQSPEDPVTCPNCGADALKKFCAVCGQNDRDYRRLSTTFSKMLGEVFEADSRLWRTLHALFLRPGFLAVEFARNRRASYVSSFRLYLFASLIYFVMASFFVGDPAQVEDGTGVADANPTETSFLADPQSINTYLEFLPLAVIVALPIYALLLQFIFLGRRVYVEHFVFVLHFQTVAFFIFVPFVPWMADAENALQFFAFLPLLGVYLFVALHRFYDRGALSTLAGWIAAIGLYILFLGVVMITTEIAVRLSLGLELSL